MKIEKQQLITCFIDKAVRGKTLLLLCLVIFSLCTLTSCEKDDDEAKIANSHLQAVDRNFVNYAAQSNLSEVGLGRLALEKTQDADIRAFAQQMIDDHTAAQNQLKTIASQNNITVPEQLDEEHTAIRNQLAALSSEAFNRAYINNQVTSHQRTSANMQVEIDHGQDNNLKAYATASKPAVDMHFNHAMEIKEEKGF